MNLVELKDKIGRDIQQVETSGASKRTNIYNDVLSALMNLGYQRPAAERAMKRIEWSDQLTIETAIRMTLKEISKS
jgi:Holliday junction resolvasome RuvABC DNA-binding subunit